MDTTERKDVRDDNEIGVTDRYRRSSNHSASATAGELRSSLPPKAHPWHLATLGSTLLLALWLLLSSCSQATSLPTGTPTLTPQAVATMAPTPTPFIEPSPTPTPKPPPLGLPPQDCPASPPPHNVFSNVGPGYGSFPVWAFGFGGPHAIARIPTSYNTYTRYGWPLKLIWGVSVHYTQPVRLHGGNLQTGTPLWFQMNGQTSTAPVLDPRPDEAQIAESGYPAEAVEWLSYLYIPAAGCYYVEADWPGGHWRITFAAGRE